MTNQGVRSCFIVTILIVCYVAASPLCGAKAKAVAFTQVTLIDGTGGAANTGMTVIVAGDRISAVGPAASIKLPKDATVIDASGLTMIPGLWDMNVILDEGGLSLPLFVACGVTGVREMGCTIEQLGRIREWEKGMLEGSRVAPRFAVCGPVVDGKRPQSPTSRITVVKAEEALEAFSRLRKLGVDFVEVDEWLGREAYFALVAEANKRRISVDGPVPMALSTAEAAIAGQKSIERLGGGLGGIVLACSSSEAGIRMKLVAAINDARDTGNSEIPYVAAMRAQFIRLLLDSQDSSKTEELFRKFRETGTWQVPALVAMQYVDSPDTADPRLRYIAPAVRSAWREFSRRTTYSREDLSWQKKLWQRKFELAAAMQRAGVRFLAGSGSGLSEDTPYLYPGFSLHDELQLLVRMGMKPLAALQAATRDAAEFLGRLDEGGTIEKGKVADMVLLDADPLQDIRNTRKIRAVVINGRYFSRTDLDQLLADVESRSR